MTSCEPLEMTARAISQPWGWSPEAWRE